MSVCPREEEVAARVSGRLPAEQQRSFDAHVATCAACRALVEELRPVAEALRAVPPAPAPDLADAVLARTFGAPARPSWRRPLSLAAGLALAATGLWLLMPPRGSAPVDEPEAARELLEQRAAPDVAAVSPSPAEAAPVATDAAGPGDEQAVSRALDWLVAAQEADGAWSPQRWGAQPGYAVGVTALALLALLSDENAVGGPAPEPARRAGACLLAQQDASGLFGPGVTGSLYNHAMACLALSDLEARHPGTVPPDALRQAVHVLTRSQREAGGWSYLRAPNSRPNTSLTAWALLALVRAEDAGLYDGGPAIPRALAWMEATVDEEGRAGYRRAGDHPRGPETLTAAAALCFLDRPSAYRDRLVRMMQRVQSDIAQSDRDLDFYRAFFQSAALREAGMGDSAEMAQLTVRLREAQERHGADAGSWPGLDVWSQAGGRVYSTAMAVLALREL